MKVLPAQVLTSSALPSSQYAILSLLHVFFNVLPNTQYSRCGQKHYTQVLMGKEAEEKAQSCRQWERGAVSRATGKPWFTYTQNWMISHFSPSSLHLQAGYQTFFPLAGREDLPQKGDAWLRPAMGCSLGTGLPCFPSAAITLY